MQNNNLTPWQMTVANRGKRDICHASRLDTGVCHGVATVAAWQTVANGLPRG